MMRLLLLIALFVSLTAPIALSQQQINAFPLRSSLWHQKQITVCWDNPSPETSRYQEMVKQAIVDTWQRNSAIEFVGWKPATELDGDIHIFINDEGPHTKGLGTKLRKKPQGMVLNFTFQNWGGDCRFDKDFCIKAIAVHEFGHALGFAHEQNRKDCQFPNCFGQEQGQDGDWVLSACDLNSVMNYCNPEYNNNGILSALDIDAIQKLYGAPPSFSPAFQGIRIVHSSEFFKTSGNMDWYKLKIYISGSEESLNEIKEVKYKLHRTFRNRMITNNYRASNFGLGLTVWGEFTLKADVFMKDGSKKELEHYLSINNVAERR